MSVPIGSFSKGMKFLVRIEYSLSMPFGMATSRFNSCRRSALVFMIAVRACGPPSFLPDLVLSYLRSTITAFRVIVSLFVSTMIRGFVADLDVLDFGIFLVQTHLAVAPTEGQVRPADVGEGE